VLKKALTILLLLTLGFSHAGYYLVTAIHQHLLKQQMKATILSNTDDNALTKICFDDNKQKITWERADEFSYEGKMYDVVRKKSIGNKLILFCADDKKETELIAAYNRSVKNHSSEKNKLNPSEKSVVVFCEPISEFSFPVYPQVKTLHHFISLLPQQHKKITAPPPRILI
jgi:hypothetical protein